MVVRSSLPIGRKAFRHRTTTVIEEADVRRPSTRARHAKCDDVG